MSGSSRGGSRSDASSDPSPISSPWACVRPGRAPWSRAPWPRPPCRPAASWAAARGVYSRVARASPTDLPRIWSRTSRAFRAETRTNRARATVFMGSGLPRRRGGGLLGLAVRLERARERELAEPVADHVLGHVHGDELLAVVDGQRVPDELRRDGRPARPRLEHLLLAGAVELLDPLVQLLVDERPLLERTSHAPLLFLSPRHDHGIRRTRAPARLVALGRLAPRGHRVVALALALAAAHRVVG